MQLAGMPELSRPEMPQHELIEFDPVIDSSNMNPGTWLQIAREVERNYNRFDGFVVIHGTDTLAHTASALPLMMRGLSKSVIMTGSQIPLIEIRNDARENLITAMIMAVEYHLPEICVFFGNRLLRGCRTSKVSASSFNAFDSPNYAPLGTVGTNINVFTHRVRAADENATLTIVPIEAQAIATFRLFPGVSATVLDNVLRQPLVALVLESYGTGNGPSNDRQLMEVFKQATDRGTVIVSCTQCPHGMINQTNYAAGTAFHEAGVISGGDMTVEAALCKLQYLFTHYSDVEEIKQLVGTDLVGELTES